MAYKIMIDEEYAPENARSDDISVEFDGVLYESRIAAWRAYWEKKHCKDYPVTAGYHVYVKEV